MILDVLDMLSNSKNVSATVKFPRHILSNVVLLVEFKNQEEVVVRVCALSCSFTHQQHVDTKGHSA